MRQRCFIAILLTAFCVLLLESASAQSNPIGRGSWRVAGSAQAVGHRDIGNDRRSSVIELAPRVGYFVFKGLSIDANLRFSRFESGGDASYEWGVGPGATYFVGKSAWRVFPYVSFRTLFRFGESIDTSTWLVGGGAVFMLVPHVGITGELSYQYSWAEIDDTGQGNDSELYGLRIGVAAFVF